MTTELDAARLELQRAVRALLTAIADQHGIEAAEDVSAILVERFGESEATRH